MRVNRHIYDKIIFIRKVLWMYSEKRLNAEKYKTHAILLLLLTVIIFYNVL